ncbi:Adenylate cyclase [hydrothermal vent metagenome]|uniref:Adenylate cyclase n=1 Tax=hydrothermal vent metagenome TaxID=652676 RepID=A0A3B0QKJ0_9ZZZZ
MSLDLKMFLADKRFLSTVKDIVGLQSAPLAIVDGEGVLLFGKEGEYLTEYPVKVGGSVVASVRGDAEAAVVARVISRMMDYELEMTKESGTAIEDHKRLGILSDIAETMSEKIDVNEIARLAVVEAGKFIDSTSSSIMLLNKDNGRLGILSAVGQEYHPKITLRPGEGIAGYVFQSGKAEVVNDVASDTRYVEGAKSANSIMCVPLKAKGRVLGVFNVSSDSGISYTEQDLQIFSILAVHVASAIQNAQFQANKLGSVLAESNLGRYISPKILEASLLGKDDISLEPVKKDIAVLFSDIRGFTATCEKLPPEEIVRNLNEYFTFMVDIIFGYGGTLNKFVGDMIVAFFGAPTETVNNERLAIETAIEMQIKLRDFPDEFIRKNFKTGIGIGSGEVVVGNVGSPQHMDYTAIGDVVNTSQRLQAIAKGGQILVTRSIYDSAKFSFEMKEIGNLKVKGRKEPVEIFEVVY